MVKCLSDHSVSVSRHRTKLEQILLISDGTFPSSERLAKTHQKTSEFSHFLKTVIIKIKKKQQKSENAWTIPHFCSQHRLAD